mgnify:CR=1 FL=1
MLKKLSLVLTLVLSFMVLVPAVSAQETVHIVHELGEAVVSKNPETVVVFDYAALDILEELGVEPAGVVKSSLPPYLAHYKDDMYADIGTLFEPNFERIYSLQPDVILISSRQADVYPELARIAPTVYLTIDTSDYWGSFTNNVRTIAGIFDKEDEVEPILGELADDFARVNKLASESGLRTLILMANDGAMSVYGPGSRFGIIHNEFGFLPADTKIESANHGQSISFEYLLQVNPDVILVIDRAATVGGSITAEQVLDNPLVKMTAAARQDQIYYLSSQVWYTASGGLQATRIMVDDVLKVFAAE